eukprot:gene967-1875_t
METFSMHGSRGPTMSLLDNKQGAGGVGNYKGVMLCNRPFAGSANGIPKTGGEGGDKNAFSCGIVPQEVGSNISISNKEQHIRRPKKETAITRHRKWLADLQRTKERLEIEYAEEVERKKDSQMKFADREAKMRVHVREFRHTSTYLDADNTYDKAEDKIQEYKTGSHANNYDHHDLKLEDEGDRERKDEAKRQPPAKDTHSKKHRPAWALTEEAAQTSTDEGLNGDEEDLLAFVSGLDYDKYIGDMEVRTMMDRVRQRISELEREIVQDERRGVDAQQRAAKRQQMDGQSTHDSDDEEDDDAADETLLAARDLLRKRQGLPGEKTGGRDLRAVHSTQSTAALVRASRDSKGGDSSSDGGPKVLNEPVVVRLDDSEGARLENKYDISKLPYMHRNPAL